MLTEYDIKKTMSRLEAAGYFIPPAASENWHEFQREWRDSLADVTHDELAAAVTDWIRSDSEWFPKAGQLLGMIQRRRTTPYYHDPDVPCPVCGAEPGAEHMKAPHAELNAEVRSILRAAGVEPPTFIEPTGG